VFTKNKQQPDVPIDEKIEAFRAELEQYIDSKIAEMKAECPGVPEQVLRNLVSHRAPGCPCLQALELARS
jgi:hypothetical protein